MLDTSQIKSWRSIVTLAVVLASGVTAQMTDAATLSASISKDKVWSLLVPCVNQCIWDNGNNDAYTFGGDIALQLSCGSPYPNGCFCRPQSATFAKSFIASCATRLCTRAGGALPQDADIASGQAIYASYCSAALGAAYTPDAVQQAPPPTAIASPGGITISVASSRATARQPTQTGGSSPDPSTTDTNSDPSSSQPDKKIMGLSMGAFIGVVVSIVCSVLGLIFGIGFKIYKHKKQQKMQGQMHQGVNGVYYTTKH